MRVSHLDLRAVLFVALCSAFSIAYVVIGARQPNGIGPLYDPTDLMAFYCGTRAAIAGADPYRAEPLRTCEHRALAESSIPLVRNLVVPAPLPGYDFALLSPLAALSFRTACGIWFLILVTAVGVTAYLILRMLPLRSTTVLYGLIGADAGASILLGQIVPIVVLAIVACGYALRLGRERLAGVAAVATMVEPHLGVPVVAAMALFVPRARIVIIVGLVALAASAIVLLGFSQCVEYFAAVLPAQARGEGLEFHRQYGWSALLFAIGLPASAALALGSISYLAMIVVGLVIGRRAMLATGDPAFLIFVPACASLIGGAYAHIAQMAAALPLAFWILARSRGTSRSYAIAALVCLAIPWQTIFADRSIAALFPAHGFIDPTPLLANVSGGSRLAQDSWDAWISTIANHDHRTPIEVFIGKVPTWFGLVVSVILAARLGSSRSKTIAI